MNLALGSRGWRILLFGETKVEGSRMEYIAVLLFLTGIALLLAYRKRRFDRTNQFGVERFPNYGAKLRERAMDGTLRLLSLVMLTTGLLMLGFRYEDCWGWVITLPLYVFALFILLGT